MRSLSDLAQRRPRDPGLAALAPVTGEGRRQPGRLVWDRRDLYSPGLPHHSMPPSDVTEALAALRDGDTEATDRLVRAVYDELRVIAHAHLRNERDDLTLVTTELVHEAYEKVLGPSRAGARSFNGRGHFFSAAARAMRQILVDHARKRNRAKRGSGVRPVALTAVGEVAAEAPVDIVDLDTALTRLAELDERQARVVECRYFGGLSVEETAEAIGISTATVKREWRMARAWLYAALRDESL